MGPPPAPGRRRIFGIVSTALLAVGLGLLFAPRCSEQAVVAPPAAPTSSASASPATAAEAASAAAYKPRPIPRIDWHTHISVSIAKPAEGFLRDHGIVRAVNLSGGMMGGAALSGDPEDDLGQNVAAFRATGDFYILFANVNFEGIGEPGWGAREVKQLERAKAAGAKGVKIAKNLGLRVRFTDGRRVPVDDPVLDPLFDAMARLNMPLAIHTGDPKAFFDPPSPTNERMDELASHPMWSFADRSKYPTWEALLDEFERRVARSPKTTIVGVHFGNAPEDPARVGRMLDKYPNFYVDTAARVPEIGRKPAEVRRVILAHPDRILFGTDVQIFPGALILGAGEGRGHTKEGVERFFTSTWRFFETTDKGFDHPTPIQGHWTIDGIDLPDDVLEKVYHGNAERLLGLPPTPR